MDNDKQIELELVELGTASIETKGGQDGLIPEVRQFWATGGISEE